MKQSFFLNAVNMISSAFKRLRSIRSTEPGLTPETWCQVQPCTTIKIASKEIILTQPTSTFFVYFLGILTIGVGLNYFVAQR